MAHKWRFAAATGNIWRLGGALVRLSVDTADIEASATTSLRDGLAETLTVGRLRVTCIVIDDGRLGK